MRDVYAEARRLMGAMAARSRAVADAEAELGRPMTSLEYSAWLCARK